MNMNNSENDILSKLEFDGIDGYYSNNYIEKYEMFNYYLDNHPNFNPNGQYNCYYKMWGIQIVLNEFLTNLHGNPVNNENQWLHRMQLQYDLVMRLINEFNSEIDLYGMYMAAYNCNLYAEKNNLPYNFYIMNFINEKERNKSNINQNEINKSNENENDFKNKRRKL